jgi:type I restriction enzyme, S subunit
MSPARVLEHFDRISEAPDAIPRLRRFILDLAVRGKLVEQDSKDEPPAELLRRIQRPASGAEATRLPEIDSSDTAFSLPRGWLWLRFGSIHNLVRGVTYTKSDVTEAPTAGYLPILRANNIGPPLNFEDLVYVRKECVSPQQLLRRGDYLIALSSGSKNLVGKAAFAAADYPGGFGGFCGVVRLMSSDLEPFAGVFLASRLYRDAISAGSRGIGINNLKRETLNGLFFPLPPLAEQHRIVAKVDELMALCDRLEAAQAERESRRDRLVAASLNRLNEPADAGDEQAFRDHARIHLRHLPRLTTRPEHIQKLRHTILNLAVRGRLVGQDPNDEPASELLAKVAAQKAKAGDAATGRDWVRDISRPVDEAFGAPSGWAWTRIANAAERVTVGFVGPMKDHYVDDGVPFLRSQNVRANRFRSDGLISISRAFHQAIRKSALAPGDVVVVRSGNVGTACVIPPSVPEGNCSDLVVVKKPHAVLPDYLCFYLNSLAARHVEEGSVGVALTHFNTKSVATMPLPLPPLGEQRRIVAKVDELMAVCDRLEAQLTTAQAEGRRLLEAVLHAALARVA